MTSSVIIKSVSSSNTLTLSEPEGLELPSGQEYFRATVTGDDLSASVKVYAYQPHGHIVSVFDKMAANWHGWKGEEKWSSLEGELTLICTWQVSGKVKIEVTLLSGHNKDDWDDWTVQSHIFIEPSQFEETASVLRQFFLE